MDDLYGDIGFNAAWEGEEPTASRNNGGEVKTVNSEEGAAALVAKLAQIQKNKENTKKVAVVQGPKIDAIEGLPSKLRLELVGAKEAEFRPDQEQEKKDLLAACLGGTGIKVRPQQHSQQQQAWGGAASWQQQGAASWQQQQGAVSW